jgi:hypothetical protein
MNYTISNAWYNDIKDLGITEDPHFVTEGAFAGCVEVDILDEDLFFEVSKNMGWAI